MHADNRRHTTAPAAVVIPVRLVPQLEPQGETWTEADRTQAARVLSDRLAEDLSTYGALVVVQALAQALRADMADAARMTDRPRLAAGYTAAATMLQGMAETLDSYERERR